MDNEARIAAIRERAQAATEGDWYAATDWDGFTFINLPGGLQNIAEVLPSNRNRLADASFIAHARDDIPWLLEQLRTLDRTDEGQP